MRVAVIIFIYLVLTLISAASRNAFLGGTSLAAAFLILVLEHQYAEIGFTKSSGASLFEEEIVIFAATIIWTLLSNVSFLPAALIFLPIFLFVTLSRALFERNFIFDVVVGAAAALLWVIDTGFSIYGIGWIVSKSIFPEWLWLSFVFILLRIMQEAWINIATIFD